MGAISEEVTVFLEKAVKAKYNIIISGGTGSGKTTFLNALSQYIPSDERIITIEDSAELQILGIDNLIRLETRNVTVDGGKTITIRDLIKTSLRMRPNRIIVGEVRGEEALDMIGSAMNCGHDGSMSSAHANSAKDMLSRLENMILMSSEIPISAIRRQIASGVDLIIHLGRLRDKSRKVLEIVEVKEVKEDQIILNPLYVFKETVDSKKEHVKGRLEKVGNLIHTYKMEAAGLEI
jgi:pilus assembly protein CpaF